MNKRIEKAACDLLSFPHQPSGVLFRHNSFFRDGKPSATNHHLGSNSLKSLTPFFFLLHINHLRVLPAVR